jgi:hypothetical protein
MITLIFFPMQTLPMKTLSALISFVFVFEIWMDKQASILAHCARISTNPHLN